MFIYEIVNFLSSLLLFATSFFLSISEKCSYTRDCSYTCICIYIAHLVREGFQTADESWPEVSEERSVYLLQALLCAGIHTHIELCHRDQVPAHNTRSRRSQRLQFTSINMYIEEILFYNSKPLAF